MSIKRVGVIGGGQLAWMMAQEAQSMGLELVVQTPNSQDPVVSRANEVVLGAISDGQTTAKLATHCDVITFENEFVDLNALGQLAQQGVCFRPPLESLIPLLDKYDQRCFLQKLGLPVPQFFATEPGETVQSKFGFPVVLKARRHGYDGQGTFIVQTADALESLYEHLKRPAMLLEEFIPFKRELAVMAARGVTGEIVVYPVVETQQEEQVCRRVIVPAQLPLEVRQQIEAIAETLLTQLNFVGVLGIELFLTAQNQVLVNEIAPRTHNSGHYSLDACETSQFKMQLQAVAGLSLGSAQLSSPGSVMVNLLGYEQSTSDYQEKRQQLQGIPNTFVYWYGKTESRPGRKMGHVTVLLETSDRLKVEAIIEKIESIWYP